MTLPPDRPRVPPPPLEHELDESEHQALDLLDALSGSELGGLTWVPPHHDDPTRRDALEQAVRGHGESIEEFRAAEASAREALVRLLALVARSQLDAGLQLAASEAATRSSLAPLAAAREALERDPEPAACLAPALETTALSLGLGPDSIAAAILAELDARARQAAPALLLEASAALVEQLEAAWPRGDAAISTPLRVFRSASVARSGRPIRARALAAEQPEQLALAERMVAVEHDPARLVEAFHGAIAALEAASRQAPDPPKPDAAPVMDGPKRSFTWIHAVLAMIVLGLSLWHYVWR